MSERTKSGWRTTEFWLSLGALLLSAAYGSGVIPDDGPWAKLAGFGFVALTAAGYSVSRGMAKRAPMLLACLVLAVASGCVSYTRVAPDGTRVSATGILMKVGGIDTSEVATNGTKRTLSVREMSGDSAMAEAIARGAVAGAVGGGKGTP